MLVQVTFFLLTALLAASSPQRRTLDSTRPNEGLRVGSPVSVRRNARTTNSEDSETITFQSGIGSPNQVIRTSRIQTNQIDDAGNQFQTTTVIKNDGNTETIQRQVLELPTPVSIDRSKPSSSDDDQLENVKSDDDQLENVKSDTGASIFLNVEDSTSKLIDEPQNEETQRNSDDLATRPPTLVLETHETEKGELAIDENVLSQMVALVNALKSKSDAKASDALQNSVSKDEKSVIQSKKYNDVEFNVRENSRSTQVRETNSGVESHSASEFSAPKGEAHFHSEEHTANENILETTIPLSENESSRLKEEAGREKITDSGVVKSLTAISELQSEPEERSFAGSESAAKTKEDNTQAVNESNAVKKSQASKFSSLVHFAAPVGEAHFETKESDHNWDEKPSGIKAKKQQSHNWESSNKAKSFNQYAVLDETLIASSSSDSPTIEIKPQDLEAGYGRESAEWPPLMPYNFAFEVRDDKTSNYQNRVEVVEDGVLRGSFSFLGADGVIRTVTYTDDGTSGFQIHTQEIPTDIIVVGSQDYKKQRSNYNSFSHEREASVGGTTTYQNQASISSGGKSSTSVASSSSASAFSSSITGSQSAVEKQISTTSNDDIGFSSSFSQGKSTTASQDGASAGSVISAGQITGNSLGNIHFVSPSPVAEGAVTAGSGASAVTDSVSAVVSISSPEPEQRSSGSKGSTSAASSSSASAFSSSITGSQRAVEKQISTTSNDDIGFSSSFSQGKSTTASQDGASAGSVISAGQITGNSLGNIHFVSPSPVAEGAVTAESGASALTDSVSAVVPISSPEPEQSSSGSRSAANSGKRRFKFLGSNRARNAYRGKTVGGDSDSSTRFKSTRFSSTASKGSSVAITGESGSEGGSFSTDGTGGISSDSTVGTAIKTDSRKSSFSIQGSSNRRKPLPFPRTEYTSVQIGLNSENKEESNEGQSNTNEEQSREGQDNKTEEESREGLGNQYEEDSNEDQGNEDEEESNESQRNGDEEESNEGQENNSEIEKSHEQENEETNEDVSSGDDTKDAVNESEVEHSKESKERNNRGKFTVKIPSVKISSASQTGSSKHQISSLISSSGSGSLDSVTSSSTGADQGSGSSASTASASGQLVSSSGSLVGGQESPVTFIIGSHSLTGSKLTEAIRNSQKLSQDQGSQTASDLSTAIGPDTPITVVLGNNRVDGRSKVIQGQFSQLSSSGAGSSSSSAGSAFISSSGSGVESISGSAATSSFKDVTSASTKLTASRDLGSNTGSSTGDDGISELSSVGSKSISSALASSSSGKQDTDVSTSSKSGAVTSTSTGTEESSTIHLSPVASVSSSSQTSGVGSSSAATGSAVVNQQQSSSGSSALSATSSTAGTSSSKSASSSQSSTATQSTQSSEVIGLKPLSVVSSVPLSTRGGAPITFVTNLALGSRGSSSSKTSASSAGISSASGTFSGLRSQSPSTSGISSFFRQRPASRTKALVIIPGRQAADENTVILPAIGGSIFKDAGASSVSSSSTSSGFGVVRGQASASQTASIDSGIEIIPARPSQSIIRGSGISSSSGFSGFPSGITSVISPTSSTFSSTSSQKSSAGASTLGEFLSGGSSGATKSSVQRLSPTSFSEKQVASTSSGGGLQQVSFVPSGGGGRLGFGSNFNSFAQNIPAFRPQVTVSSQPANAAFLSHGGTQQISTTGETGGSGFSIVRAKPGFLKIQRPLSSVHTNFGSSLGNIGQLIADQGVFGLTPTGSPNQLFITADIGKQLGGSSSSSFSSGLSSSISNFKPSVTLEQSIARGLRPSVPASIAFGKTFPSVGNSGGGFGFGTSQF